MNVAAPIPTKNKINPSDIIRMEKSVARSLFNMCYIFTAKIRLVRLILDRKEVFL
jgi:hypothetical protein